MTILLIILGTYLWVCMGMLTLSVFDAAAGVAENIFDFSLPELDLSRRYNRNFSYVAKYLFRQMLMVLGPIGFLFMLFLLILVWALMVPGIIYRSLRD